MMENYLLAWNPNRWVWPDFNEKLNNFKNEIPVFQEWSTRNNQIKKDDRVFMIRLVRQPKGVFASGIVTETNIQAPHYLPEEAAQGITIPFIKFKFDILLDCENNELIDEATLHTQPLNSQHWYIQSSGAHIKNNIADDLYKKLKKFIPLNIPATEEVNEIEGQPLFEGSLKSIKINRYERNPYARKLCIEHYGLNCQICDFNFENQYGELGKDYIHVHHLKPLSEIGESYNVDPINDLIPVCPNCHAMIHKNETALTINEIKNLLVKR